MTKLQGWLKELGLEQYAGIFADNDIDFDILSDLAESDFEKLGSFAWPSPETLESTRGVAAYGQQTRSTADHVKGAGRGTTSGHSAVFRLSGFHGAG